jgi:bifunctional DNA-binding transcriptional regulator/antitoxin component of YhaV-PrlF toxin-antitoxin module
MMRCRKILPPGVHRRETMTTPQDTSLPVAYLTTARLGEKGQLTLPKASRDAVALAPGAPITVLQVGSVLLLLPDDARFRALCDRVAATFARHEIQAPDLLATLPDARERVVARHYPQLATQEHPAPRGKRA